MVQAGLRAPFYEHCLSFIAISELQVTTSTLTFTHIGEVGKSLLRFETSQLSSSLISILSYEYSDK